jgi:hypothetical protein
MSREGATDMVTWFHYTPEQTHMSSLLGVTQANRCALHVREVGFSDEQRGPATERWVRARTG